jgi:acetoacetyl-CoA synthetase
MAVFVSILINDRVTHLGISPRWLHELQQAKIKPREIVDLSSLQVVTSTGMVLRDALFEWFYDEGFPSRARLNNISGGTDLAASFATSNPLSPVYVGGCAGGSLGIPLGVFDSTIEGGYGTKGVPVEEGEAGELVATAAFPTMPTMFWGDQDGKKYFDAYFARFDSKIANASLCMQIVTDIFQTSGHMVISSPYIPSPNRFYFMDAPTGFSIRPEYDLDPPKFTE